uniref:DNA 3'-5' helicase n=1 Tax=Anopheles atroparvus TaxID=41427 RepID=A0A182JB72_ANOAO
MAQLTLPQTFTLVPQNVLSAEARPFTFNDLPPAVRAVFPGLKTFNKLQLTVAGAVLRSDDSLVVNAPTGSGKTVILELAIVKLAVACAEAAPGQFRVVYLAPTRSLCAEKYHDWRVRFAALGISCIQYDGDNAVEDIGRLGQHQLILSTPEKWEVFTRHWGDQTVASVLRPIRLFLIDEIQVMDDGVRGANLELVVSRMKYIDARLHREQLDGKGRPESIRFIAVSACIPNVDDIARWLKNGRDVQPFSFAETYRATRIGRHVVGFPCTSNPYKFELDLNYKLPAIIDEHSRQKPTLIFCSSRRSAETTANFLARSSMRRILPSGPILAHMTSQLASKGLQDCVAKGVAYHHAGLLHADRTCIEGHFRSGHLAALCCTSTLCMGVNLPAYLVIIKSTFSYAGKNYSDNYILQMIGRAGRAQYNEDGVAVILTADEHAEHYRKLVAGTAPVESQLHHRLAELLNSEIAHGIIYDQPAVMEWVRSTFFHVRARTNPGHYQLSGARDTEDGIEQLCRDTIDSLEESGLILRRRPNVLLPTACGKLMTRNHLSFKTMKLLQSELKGTESLQQMLQLVTRAHEFCEYKCRNNEKRILNSLNAPSSRDAPAGQDAPEEPHVGVRFRWPGRISSTEAKVYCLVQAVFGNLPISDHGLHQEAAKIVTLGARIGRCVVGLLDTNGDKLPAGCFGALLNVTRLIQCFQAKLWYDSPFLTKQLDQIGPKLARHLADRGKVTFEAVRESDPREIEWILKKQPPFGNDIISFVDGLPQFTIEITKTVEPSSEGAKEPAFSCTVTQRNAQFESARQPISFSVIVGDSANRLLLYRTVESTSPRDEAGGRYTWPIVPSSSIPVVSLSAHLICQDWVGLDCAHTLHLVEPPVTTKHKQTTITHFFPNQTIANDATMMLQEEQFSIPSAQEMPTGGNAMSTVNESLGISAYFNPLRAFNRSIDRGASIPNQTITNGTAREMPRGGNVVSMVNESLGISAYFNPLSALNRSIERGGGIPEGLSNLQWNAPQRETAIDNQTSLVSKRFGVPAALKSIRAITTTTMHLSAWDVNGTTAALLRKPVENVPSLRAMNTGVGPAEESFIANVISSASEERFDLPEAFKATRNASTASIDGGNTSSLVFPRPPPSLPIRSILKRPAPTAVGGEAIKNPQRTSAAVKPRRSGRPFFSSDEFRHMFRRQKCTQSFTFCSPAEDILHCFRRHNIFMPVDGSGARTWCSLFDEDRENTPAAIGSRVASEGGCTGQKEALASAVRKRKNFDLGPAENVICIDE